MQTVPARPWSKKAQKRGVGGNQSFTVGAKDWGRHLQFQIPMMLHDLLVAEMHARSRSEMLQPPSSLGP